MLYTKSRTLTLDDADSGLCTITIQHSGDEALKRVNLEQRSSVNAQAPRTW
jgi:hypothetical protein